MQIGGAGYIDGHHGEWMTPVPLFEQLATTFWNRGYQIYVHTNGDAELEMVLGTLQMLQEVKPRIDHRLTIEHFGYGTDEQVRKLARLGAIVSANPYYMYEMGDEYLRQALGLDRTSQMVRIGSVARAGVPSPCTRTLPWRPPSHCAWRKSPSPQNCQRRATGRKRATDARSSAPRHYHRRGLHARPRE